MGPRKAAEIFAAENPGAEEFKVTLYGSLAKTGRGHRTDVAVVEAFAPRPCAVMFDEISADLPHANTLDFCAIKAGNVIAKARVLSVGGGDIEFEGRPKITPDDVYPHSSFDEIAAFCTLNKIKLWEYVERYEGTGIWEFLRGVWLAMMREIDEGLEATGILPGGLNVERKAKYLYNQAPRNESEATRENRIVCSYAFAAGEQNADLGIVVTAPTCGACAVVPAVLRYAAEKYGFGEKKILKALAVSGLIGCLIKENASISGAECGCQAEIGSACSMAAAALCDLFDMNSEQIEYAAEVAMEHYLGLTCDPICGLVQIPCIERNAVAAMRAINCLSLATFLTDTSKISFDFVVKTMYETGKDIPKRYRETAEGGLAKLKNNPE